MHATQAAAASGTYVQVRGTAFMEWASPDPRELVRRLERIGFTAVGHGREGAATWMQQGDIHFIVSATPGSHGARFAGAHGPSCAGMAFRVDDAAAALGIALRQDARVLDAAADSLVPGSVLSGIGGSALYLVDDAAWAALRARFVFSASAPAAGSPFRCVDHVTHCVGAGHMQAWVEFYGRVFGFEPVFKFVAGDATNGFDTIAVRDPLQNACVTVLEPMGAASQIQEFINEYAGEGIQHVAMASDDLYASVERLRAEGVELLPTPDAYYAALDERLPGHGEDVARMRELGLLIDGAATGENPDAKSKLLLQVFTRKWVGPIFFEAIQRKGNPGFGEGNAVALFEAIKREQAAQGTAGASAS